MSVRATFPMFLEMEEKHRSLIVGMIRRRRARARAARPRPAPARGPQRPRRRPHAAAPARAGHAPTFCRFETGLADLADAVVADLPADRLAYRRRRRGVVCGTCGKRRGQPRRLRGRRPTTACASPTAPSVVVQAIVLAVPAFAAGELLGSIAPAASSDLSSIPYVTTATVSLAYRRADVARPLRGFGFVVPRAEERGIMAGTFSSLKFAGRAPDDGVLVRAFVGRAGREGLGRAARRRAAPSRASGACEHRRPASRAAVHPHLPLAARHAAVPRRSRGARSSAIESRVGELPGVELAGGYLHGIGIGDCIREGAGGGAARRRPRRASRPNRRSRPSLTTCPRPTASRTKTKGRDTLPAE